MSKASEWAKAAEVWLSTSQDAYRNLEGYPWTGSVNKDGTRLVHASVNQRGGLSLNASTLTPEQAQSLARWILDTFGEPRP